MRQSYVHLFQNIRNSSLWAYDSDVRIVWITLLTLADPEGYVGAALPGIAIQAQVTLEAAQRAMALFEAEDLHSRSTEHGGRRIEKVHRGWRILNFEEFRALAKAEAERARKREWARTNRATVADSSEMGKDRSEPVDASGSGIMDPNQGSEPGSDLGAQPEAAPKPKKPRKSGTRIPDDFTPNAGCLSLATELGASNEEELPKFIDHHTARGTVMVDWQAGYRTWLRNSLKFGNGPRSRQDGRGSLFQQGVDRIRKLEEQGL